MPGLVLARPWAVPRERIPIAVVLTSFDPGGTERQMTELIARLDRDRFEVHAACFRREGHWLPRVERSAASVATFPIRSFRSPATAAQLVGFAAWCRRRRIAVVQACDFYANVFGLAGAALARVPVRIGSRRDLVLPGRSSGQHRLQRHAYRLAHRVIANSRAAAAQLAAEGVAEARIAVIPNGIDLSRYPHPRTSKPSTRRPSGPSDLRTLTTVANLRAEKGHDVLLSAAAIVCSAYPDLRVQLVGAGPMRAALEQQARDLGIEEKVIFCGHREDVPELLAASDLFVLPSQSEAFPNGLVEAMAAGLPSIASDVGGIPELVQHGRNGLLVPPGDVAALAAALVRLLDDADYARRLGDAARDTIETRYSFERMVTAFEQLYLSELAGSRFPIPALYAR
jgi:glycosyltransferase involved in cell wall biosynthesis